MYFGSFSTWGPHTHFHKPAFVIKFLWFFYISPKETSKALVWYQLKSDSKGDQIKMLYFLKLLIYILGGTKWQDLLLNRFQGHFVSYKLYLLLTWTFFHHFGAVIQRLVPVLQRNSTSSCSSDSWTRSSLQKLESSQTCRKEGAAVQTKSLEWSWKNSRSHWVLKTYGWKNCSARWTEPSFGFGTIMN